MMAATTGRATNGDPLLFLRMEIEMEDAAGEQQNSNMAQPEMPIPITYFRPLKNMRGEKPQGFTMIARPIVDPIDPDRAGIRPPAGSRP
jgi:hypothetical protein